MNNAPQVAVSLTISILDSPIKGTIFLLNWKGEKASFCTCRGLVSPLFTDGDETSLNHDCREWFLEQFDGFVNIKKNEGPEAEKALQLFSIIKQKYSEFH